MSTAMHTAVLPRSFTASTVCEAFQITAAERPDAIALRTLGGGVEITWAEYSERVRRIAGGLAALGIGRGDTVALMMTNRPEFNLVDTAAMHLGATPFSIYNTSAPDQISYLFSNADNSVVVCERQFVDAIRAADAALVQHVVVIDDEVDGTLTLADLEAACPEDFDFDKVWRAVEPEDVLTIIYTSGTTGPPKGVQLTHASTSWPRTGGFAAIMPSQACGQLYLLSSLRPTSGTGCSRTTTRASCSGAAITAIADRAAGGWQRCRRSARRAWGAVPRIWEKIKAALEAKGIVDPSVRCPMSVKAAHPDAARARPGAVAHLSPRHRLPPRCSSTSRRWDCRSARLWGMSRDCPASPRSTRPTHNRIGTVGKAIPGVELKLADDGELLVRGADRDEGLPQGSREDAPRRSTPTAGCTPATSRRSTRTVT